MKWSHRALSIAVFVILGITTFIMARSAYTSLFWKQLPLTTMIVLHRYSGKGPKSDKLSYTYTLDGKTYSGTGTLCYRSDESPLEIQSRQPVHVSPHFPTWNYLDGCSWSYRNLWIIFLILGLLMLITRRPFIFTSYKQTATTRTEKNNKDSDRYPLSR